MIHVTSGAVVLEHDETVALGMLVAIRKLEDAAEWLEWEDLPQLDQDGFDMVIDAIRDQAGQMSTALGRYERANDIDARRLMSEVT